MKEEERVDPGPRRSPKISTASGTPSQLRGAEKRKEHGSQGARVFRDPNEDNRVWVVFDLDEEGYQSLMSDPEMPAVFQEAGLQGRPQSAKPAGQTDA